MFYADDDEASADEERELYIENASAEKLYSGYIPKDILFQLISELLEFLRVKYVLEDTEDLSNFVDSLEQMGSKKIVTVAEVCSTYNIDESDFFDYIELRAGKVLKSYD